MEGHYFVMQLAHDSQIKHTFNYGAALRWDGFVLLFHLLCDKKDLQVCWGGSHPVSQQCRVKVWFITNILILFPPAL